MFQPPPPLIKFWECQYSYGLRPILLSYCILVFIELDVVIYKAFGQWKQYWKRIQFGHLKKKIEGQKVTTDLIFKIPIKFLRLSSMDDIITLRTQCTVFEERTPSTYHGEFGGPLKFGITWTGLEIFWVKISLFQKLKIRLQYLKVQCVNKRISKLWWKFYWKVNIGGRSQNSKKLFEGKFTPSRWRWDFI